MSNAWAAGEEDEKGTLEAGKLADLVVLDRDPFTVDPAELQDLEVLLTVVGGEARWSTLEDAPPASSVSWPGSPR